MHPYKTTYDPDPPRFESFKFPLISENAEFDDDVAMKNNPPYPVREEVPTSSGKVTLTKQSYSIGNAIYIVSVRTVSSPT